MCTSLWAEVERDKMSVSCVRWKGKHGDFSSGRLFMPLVYALQTTNANQMLVTLLKWLWRIGIQTNRPSAKLKDFMFHFQIFIPLFFFFLGRTDPAGKETGSHWRLSPAREEGWGRGSSTVMWRQLSNCEAGMLWWCWQFCVCVCVFVLKVNQVFPVL